MTPQSRVATGPEPVAKYHSRAMESFVIEGGRPLSGTVRAALDVLLDYGRPSSVELAVLVDRGGRELPIQPTYVVLATSVPDRQRVEVVEVDGGWRAVAQEVAE